jgi:hypothetical protein
MNIIEFFFPFFVIVHIILLGLCLIYLKFKIDFFWILVFGVILFLLESITSYIIFIIFDFQLKFLLLIVSVILVFLHVSKAKLLRQYLTQNRIQFISHTSVLVLSSTIAWTFTFLPVTKPDVLIDGPYVWKNWSLPVQMQRLALDYPPDNALPAVVGEYLIQRLSFEKIAPIMPGQAVGNRTFMMSFPYVASRISFTEIEKKVPTVAQFEYVRTNWPDTLSLLTDRNFRIYLGTTIPLNLLILNLVIWYYFRNLFLKKFSINIIAMVLAISLTPLAIFNSVFSWPKNFAAFFIAIASYFIVKNRFILSSFFWCFSYLVHPLALPYLAVPVFILLIKRKSYLIKKTMTFYLLPIATVSIWFIWVKFIIDSDFDLFGQNTKTNESLTGQLWIRVYNLNILTFGNFLDSVPFGTTTFLNSYFASLMSIFGISVLLLLYFFQDVIRQIINTPEIMLNLFFSLVITALFSYPIASINHGWQSFWPFLLASFLIVISKKSLLIKYLGVLSLLLSHLVIYLIWINEVI